MERSGQSKASFAQRGARQVGKTYSIRKLGVTFTSFVEINLEANEAARLIIEKDMDPHRIVRELSELLQVDIIPGSTLLFFDEIQIAPQAITTLRYFFEEIPQLHVAAAGSLLDFAIEEVGVPVGRVSSLYMYPLSFLEFLAALGHSAWVKLIIDSDLDEFIQEPIHKKLLALVGEYLAIGGMPEAVNEWVKTKTSRASKIVLADLLFNYQQDFGKYAKRHQIKYLNILFQRLLNPKTTFVSSGEIVEAFVGQELLVYSDPIAKESLFYWRRQKRVSQAEIDYVVQIKGKVVPIEVKAGTSKRI